MAAWGSGTPRTNKTPEPIFTPKTNPFGDNGPDFDQDAAAPVTTFPDVVKEGWSYKKGPQTFMGWKRRFIQLKGSNKQLNYYTDETMVQKKGTVFLSGLSIHHIARSTKTSDSQHHGFSIMTPQRTYQFCVASATDRDHWIQKIREIVDAKWDAHKIGQTQSGTGGTGGKSGSISYSSSKRAKELGQGFTGTPVATSTPTTDHLEPVTSTQMFSAAESWDDDDDVIGSQHTFQIKNNLLKNGHHSSNAEHLHTDMPIFMEDIEDDDDDTDARYAHRKKYKQQQQQQQQRQMQMSEEEAMQRVQQLEHKNDAMLDQALQTTYNTQMVATDTAQKLSDQRTQLVNIDKNLHEIDQDLDKTDGILDGMKSWSGMIKRKLKKNKTPTRQEYEAPVSNESTFERKHKQQNGHGTSTASSAYDQATSENNENEYEQRQDQKLDELLKGVKALNQTATDINEELEDQDVLLDSIDKKFDKVQPKMQQQNKVMHKMLR
eukprot:CAMPEP_0202686624 /NCGR_PEP_ID=MMETSP1385-20130828/2373_1 /ASSEMBLY_ACC=CAM_ASM_000861 /TAXON_ID=933848 /ORGANISM="Elphidium margaritaceum" /LENGTH=489 /DNA_ID=CAMNT_0049341239 /DNA_START=24 /DNA_END=1493 /DNA_ORIENTATION=+